MARPPEKPLQKEGRYTYIKLGEQLYCFPTICISDTDIGSIRAINSGYAKGMDQELNSTQHNSLQKLIRNHRIMF